jgi:trehalose 6-phosphate synthase
MSGERLIVVSNRIPTEEVPSGGLVVALHEALSETGGLWIGAHPDMVDDPTDGLVDLPGGGYARKAFRLTEEERRTYYLGYANSVLWPLCHRRSTSSTSKAPSPRAT